MRASIALICALLVYGTASVVFTSRDLGRTYDERLYNEAGLIYLQQHRFDENHDHPPLSKTLAAIYPYWSGERDDAAFRYSHAAIFAVGGGVIAFQLLAWGFPLAAVIFSLLYFLCPNLKAMAALNVLDSDCAILLAWVALYTWRGFTQRTSAKVGFLQGLAASTKITALVYLPFLAWRLRKHHSGRSYLFAFLGFFLAILASYQFRLLQLGWFGASLGFQWKHNHAGQMVYLLGHWSARGFWYNYIVLFFLKNPLSSVLLMTVALGFLLRSPRRYSGVGIYLVAPAVLIFTLLSAASVQLGFRYTLPAMLELYLATALILDQEIRTQINRRRIGFAAIAVLGTALFYSDVHQLARDTYLAYFNSLAPNPTRYFCDSNIDWQQGIPKHLSKRLPPRESIETLSAFRSFSAPSLNEVYVEAGASNLCGAWSNKPFTISTLGPLLLGFNPYWKGAGYEVFKLSGAEIFTLWKIHDQTPAKERSYLRVLSALEDERRACASSQKLAVRSGARSDSRIEVLVAIRSVKEPYWISRKGTADLHPFYRDGESDEGSWRAWIPGEFANTAAIVDRDGTLLSYPERKITVSLVCE